MVTLGAIILAAGASSRMGQSKQMLPVDGRPLLANTINAVLDAGITRTVVVLGANENLHREILRNAAVDIAVNQDWALGMGKSIRTGLQSLLTKYPDLTGILILVCDQPLLTAEVISRIVETFYETGRAIIASEYQGTEGVPVLFGQAYFDKLRNLPDDQGAKKLVRENPSDVALVSFPGGATDLDTMDDYKAFIARRHD